MNKFFKLKIMWFLLSLSILVTTKGYAKDNNYFRSQASCVFGGAITQVFYPNCQSLILDTENGFVAK